MCPARLINGEQIEKCRVAASGELQNVGSTFRANLANSTLKQLETEKYLHKAPTISY